MANKDIFESMEQVKEYAKELKKQAPPNTDDDFIDLLLGLYQGGDAVHVDGIGLIDKSIAPIVHSLNQKGFQTLSSCSGIKSEHTHAKFSFAPVLVFKETEDIERKKRVQSVATELKLNFHDNVDCYLQQGYRIELPSDMDDDKLLSLWKELYVKLISEGNEV
ncbi:MULTISPECIES: hypothetical protein [Bacillus cereus group]|uniref:Uncharacterized protein n=1 Tax=Bacillus cereus TaxID=1396 RepID=A0A9X6VVI9_BACCE|nr:MULTISPECIES: hypothetical protein [Bacillus cereus group]PEZ75303.1 hypothetical protein CN410_14615 [Bacillus anthracis]PFF46079.1 hypothetical protein CN357_21770 [Bacillus cereus]PFQ36448.1 hypothetical protein COK33_16890 [Bacillus cereus]PGB17931.1 hypothetical protein COM09_03875 [Bacillus toyonensis]